MECLLVVLFNKVNKTEGKGDNEHNNTFTKKKKKKIEKELCILYYIKH